MKQNTKSFFTNDYQSAYYKIFVMTYLNTNYSLKYNHEFPDSATEETQLLKQKLLETHQKLISELSYSKQLEEQISEFQDRYEATMAENENVVKKYGNLLMKYQKQKIGNDKSKILQNSLVQSQKKNDLLRIDLESMRTKILELASHKQNLQDNNIKLQASLHKFNDKLGQHQHELKLKENLIAQLTEDNERLMIKIEKQMSLNRQIEIELQDNKKERNEMIQRYEEMENVMKQEKQRQGKIINELLMVQKQLKDNRQKVESLSKQMIQIKQESNFLKVKGRQEERNLSAELQKLMGEYNNLHALYKQKDQELEEAKKKPLEEISRKKNQFQKTKELVGKLDREQKAKIAQRNSPNKSRELSPRINFKNVPRTYKQEKEEYLSIIESVGSKETQMLSCNMERKKILCEIDRIDETRVKTKQMIARRRRLQVQLQNEEKKLQSIRNELKKLKVI